MRAVGLLLLLLCASCAARTENVDWRDAASCVNRLCTMSGTVVADEDQDGARRLYFDRERRDVSALLVRSLFVTWPSYSGRTIAATGKVRRFRDTVEIVVDHPTAIAVVGGETAAPAPRSPDVAPEDDSATESPEVERLHQQVERLEERVRELEGQKK